MRIFETKVNKRQKKRQFTFLIPPLRRLQQKKHLRKYLRKENLKHFARKFAKERQKDGGGQKNENQRKMTEGAAEGGGRGVCGRERDVRTRAYLFLTFLFTPPVLRFFAGGEKNY